MTETIRAEYKKLRDARCEMIDPALVCRSSYIGFSSSSNTTIFCRNQSSSPEVSDMSDDEEGRVG